MAGKPIILDKPNDGRLIGHAVIDEVLPGIGRDHQQGQARPVTATSLGMRRANASQLRRYRAAKPGPGQAIRAGLRGVNDLAKLVIVPAVRIVVGDDHCRARPVGCLTQEVDGVHDPGLRIEGIGIAGMFVLIARRLQEADGGKVACRDGIEEVVGVILMVAGIALLPDGLDGRWAGMLKVLRGNIVLKGWWCGM